MAALEDRLYTRWSHRGEPASAVCYRVADGVVLGVRAAPDHASALTGLSLIHI